MPKPLSIVALFVFLASSHAGDKGLNPVRTAKIKQGVSRIVWLPIFVLRQFLRQFEKI